MVVSVCVSICMCVCVRKMGLSRKEAAAHQLLPTPNWHQGGKSMPGQGVCGGGRGALGAPSGKLALGPQGRVGSLVSMCIQNKVVFH